MDGEFPKREIHEHPAPVSSRKGTQDPSIPGFRPPCDPSPLREQLERSGDVLVDLHFLGLRHTREISPGRRALSSTAATGRGIRATGQCDSAAGQCVVASLVKPFSSSPLASARESGSLPPPKDMSRLHELVRWLSFLRPVLESAKLAGVEPDRYLRTVSRYAIRGERIPLPHELVVT
jgi:hypothetical protein